MARKKKGASSRKLFCDPSGQTDLFEKSLEEELEEREAREVECLGMTFDSEEARREYFLGKLREKLRDPSFRRTPGFPEGTDDDILRLSDPPYYTACPNPFIELFVESRKGETKKKSTAYRSTPFSSDVKEGRSDAIYTAHTYHTKVPPRAIARYIFHYTSPGDLVLDSFCGSGMTGVAVGMCADNKLAAECGGTPGPRAAILCDLSPAATFIASVYNRPPQPHLFDSASNYLMGQVEEIVGELWELDTDAGRARVEYQVWGEQFTCPICQEFITSDQVLQATKSSGTATAFPCPSCDGLVSKAPKKSTPAARLERRLQATPDNATGSVRNAIVRRPLMVGARLPDGKRLVFEAGGDLARRLDQLAHDSDFWYPVNKLIHGERFLRKDCNAAYGITRVHHFYLPRQLKTLAAMYRFAETFPSPSVRPALRFFVQSNSLGMTVMNRYGGPGQFSHVNKFFSGTLYVPSMVAESSHVYTYANKRKRLVRVFGLLQALAPGRALISSQSATDLSQIPDSSVDYVFIDPPFGRNLQYSELNQIWEAWLRVSTNREPEAVMDATRDREIPEYGELIRQALSEVYRVLKPNRWVTIVFHNSSNRVWFAIQESLGLAGFVVADVRVLSKGWRKNKIPVLGAIQSTRLARRFFAL